MKQYPIHWIEWIDPHSVDEWTDIEDISSDRMKIIAVGQVIKETEHTLILALNVNYENDDASCTMVIPRAAIINQYIISF